MNVTNDGWSGLSPATLNIEDGRLAKFYQHHDQFHSDSYINTINRRYNETNQRAISIDIKQNYKIYARVHLEDYSYSKYMI